MNRGIDDQLMDGWVDESVKFVASMKYCAYEE